MGLFARKFGEVYARIRSDIYAFCRTLNFEPTHQQRMLLDAVQAAQNGTGIHRIACKSGQGPGKTTCSVVIALWRCIQAVNAMTILTAPTMRQCNEVWLAEARRILANADPMWNDFIKITKTKIEVAGQADWGVKTVTASKEENAQGFHEKNMTIICEEASGISRKIIEQFKGTASNPNCLFLMIGNPNTRDCAFFDCFNSQRHNWHCITFNAEHTPRSAWFDPKRNEQLAEEFGRESDVYRVRVLGEFPHADPNCVMSSEDLEKVTDKALIYTAARIERSVGGLARQFGLDFARYGGDESVLFRRSGNAIVEWYKRSHIDPSLLVAKAFEMQHNAGWKDRECWFVADAGGMGQGVMHRFYDARKQVMEFHSAGTAANSQQFDNKITEGWFNLAKMVRGLRCYLPYDNQLIQQLSGRRYFLTKKGKFILETKKDYMDRGHESPDRADACVMSFYDHVLADVRLSTRRAG